MDTRTGDLYPTREAALDAGVPDDQIEHVGSIRENVIVRIASGPFRGRVYERRVGGQLIRRPDLEGRSPATREALIGELQDHVRRESRRTR